MCTWSTSSRGDAETPHASAASTTTMPHTTARRRRRRGWRRSAPGLGAGAAAPPWPAGSGGTAARVLTRPLPGTVFVEADHAQLGNERDAGGVEHPPPHLQPRARCTSSAVAPASAWKKLACLADTTAPPTRRPLSPSESMIRPAESPGGLANTEPALAPPGWCSRRQRTIVGDARLARGGGRRRGHAERRAGDHLGRAERRAPVPEGERRQRAGAWPGRPPAARSTTSRLDQHVGGLPPVAARVHPHRAADAARDPDEELEPGATGRRRRAGPAPGAATARAGPRRRRRIRRRGRRSRTRRRAPARAPGTRRRRPAGSSRARRRGAAGAPSASAPASAASCVGRPDPRQHRQRATDPVGGEVGDGHVTLDRVPRPPRDAPPARRGRARRAHGHAGAPATRRARW